MTQFEIRDTEVGLNWVPEGYSPFEWGLIHYADLIRDINVSKGWYKDIEERTFAEDIVLIISELTEALEEYRNNKGYAETYTEYPDMAKPEGIPTEMADVLIRFIDVCDRYGIPVFEAMGKKLEYNMTRPYRHGGKKL